MKLCIIFALITLTYAAKLDNNYLPPNSGKLAGGNGQILAVPSSNAHVSGGGSARSAEANAAILKFDNQNNGDGSYQFEFETENKIKQSEQGQLKNAGSEQESIEVHGSYSYVDPEGQLITVNYIADENGFQPSGEHLPTPPPIPEAILRSLEINAAAEANGNNGYSSQQSANSQSGYKY